MDKNLLANDGWHSSFPLLCSFPGHSSSFVFPSPPLSWIDRLLPAFSGLTAQFRDGGVRVTIRLCVCAYCDGLKGSLGPLGSTVAADSSLPGSLSERSRDAGGLGSNTEVLWKRQRKLKHRNQKLSTQRRPNSVMNNYVIALCYIRYCVQFPKISALLVQLKVYLHRISLNYRIFRCAFMSLLANLVAAALSIGRLCGTPRIFC